jgi:hypothetical protein
VGVSLGVRVKFKRGHARGRLCARGPVHVRVGGADATDVARVSFYAGPRRIARDARPPFAKPIPLRFLRATSLVRTVVFLKDSRVATLDKRVRACR